MEDVIRLFFLFLISALAIPGAWWVGSAVGRAVMPTRVERERRGRRDIHSNRIAR